MAETLKKAIGKGQNKTPGPVQQRSTTPVASSSKTNNTPTSTNIPPAVPVAQMSQTPPNQEVSSSYASVTATGSPIPRKRQNISHPPQITSRRGSLVATASTDLYGGNSFNQDMATEIYAQDHALDQELLNNAYNQDPIVDESMGGTEYLQDSDVHMSY